MILKKILYANYKVCVEEYTRVVHSIFSRRHTNAEYSHATINGMLCTRSMDFSLQITTRQDNTGFSLSVITARVRTYDGRLCFHRCVSVQEGGSQVSDFQGGVPGLRFSGGVPGLRFSGGSQVSDFWGGVPGLRFLGVGGYPVSVK